MRKNATKIAALALSLALTVTSVNVPTNASAASVKLNKTKATLYLNGPSKKKVSKLVVKGTNKKVTFTSSNKSVVKVNKNGKITAKATGKATITAKVNKKSYKCNVTVKKTYKPVTSITVSPKTVTLNVGKKKTLKTTVKPAKPTNKKVAYTSDRKSVATVSSAGKVTAKKAGTAKITVKTKGIDKNNKHKKATVAVTVKDVASDNTPTPPADSSAAPSTEPSAAPSDEPTTDPTEGLRVLAVTAVTSTKLNVTFSKSVDDTISASNFTLSDGASVTGVELNDDHTVATLIANGLVAGNEYTLTVSGVTAGDDQLAVDFTTTFTAIKDECRLQLENTLDGKALKADGKASTLVKASLVNSEDEVIPELDSVELRFETTAGNFANQTVTVQKGIAENTFTSESLVTAKTAMITVTIINASDKDLINKTATMNIVMDPNPDAIADDSVGAMLADVKVQTADRVALFFNKEVNVTDFTSNKEGEVYKYDDKKLEIEITDSAKPGSTIPVYGLSAIPGNPQALYAYTGKGSGNDPNNPNNLRKELTDNAVITVKATDKTKAVPVPSSGKAVLQDITNPALLSVTNKGLTTIVLTFSEAVNWEADPAGRTYDSSAVNLKNYVIDGVPLTHAIYGAASPASITVNGYDTKDGTDYSNIVTIKLGKKWAENNKARQIYMQSGRHSVQVSNVGDAANRTDTDNNKLITQSLDFTIDPDDSLVEATVEVQSPEQYIVTLSKEIDDAEQTLQEVLELQRLDAGKYVKETRGGQDIQVSLIDGTDGKKFRVDTKVDWTKVYGTKASHKNYYNDSYRLFIPKETIENPGNGKMNSDIAMPLDDAIMKNPDVTSPKILGVKLNKDGKTFDISLSEPVQVPGAAGMAITPNETQDAAQGVPMPTVAFIKKDLSATISADIKSVDGYHSTIKVAPKDELTAGIWDVVVYSISDDIGNTAATLVEPDFEVKSTVVAADGFKALWIVAVPAYASANDPIAPVTGGALRDEDVVYIKYNKNIAVAGHSENVVDTSNYQVNGGKIPVSTKIAVEIPGYNDKVLTTYADGTKDTIAIYLNKGTLASDSNNVFIAETLQSKGGAKIENGGLKTLDRVGNISASNVYFAWQYKIVSSADIDTVKKLQDALDSDENFNVTASPALEGSEAATYTISKAMTVNFANNKAKALTIKTDATGTITVKDLTVEDVTIDAPNADVVFEGVKVEKNTGLDADKQGKGKVELQNVCALFELDATSKIEVLEIAAGITHDITIAGENGTVITTLDNRAKAQVTLDPLTITTLNQYSEKELVLDEVTIETLNIRAAATLNFINTASTITTLNVANGITIAAITSDIDITITNVNKNVTFADDGTSSGGVKSTIGAVVASEKLSDKVTSPSTSETPGTGSDTNASPTALSIS